MSLTHSVVHGIVWQCRRIPNFLDLIREGFGDFNGELFGSSGVRFCGRCEVCGFSVFPLGWN
jgi:hypothetical protein